jgi:hypothetical protein
LAIPSAVSYRMSVYAPDLVQLGTGVSDVMTAHS